MSAASTLRAAAIVEAAAARRGHKHWARIAADLNALADELTPPVPEPQKEE